MTILIYLWRKSWIFRLDGLADGGITNVKDLPEIILKNFWDNSARIIFKNWGSFITVVHLCKRLSSIRIKQRPSPECLWLTAERLPKLIIKQGLKFKNSRKTSDWTIYDVIREVPWNAPKLCEGDFIHVIAFWFFLKMTRNSKSLDFGSFSVSNLITCFSSKCPTFDFFSLK